MGLTKNRELAALGQHVHSGLNACFYFQVFLVHIVRVIGQGGVAVGGLAGARLAVRRTGGKLAIFTQSEDP